MTASKEIALFLLLSGSYITLLLSNIVPPLLLSILLPLLYVGTGVGSISDIFSVWSYSLLYILAGGIVISDVIQNSGISQNIVNYFCKFSNFSFYRLMYLLGCIGIVLTFLIPSSTCRCLIFIVLCTDIAKQLSIKPLSIEASCLFICGYFACTAPRWIVITGDLGGIAATNIFQVFHNTKIPYLEHLYYNVLPSLIYTFACISLALILLRPKADIHKYSITNVTKGTKYRNSKILILIMMLLILTDFIHNIDLSIIFVSAAVVAFIPKLNIMTNEEFNKLSFSPIFVLAGILSIGVAVKTCGFLDVIVDYINSFDNDYLYLKIFSITALSVNLLCSLPTVVALCPVVNSIATTYSEALNYTYLVLYGVDQIILPSAWAVCLYFYLTNYIKLKHLMMILIVKAILSIPLVLMFQFIWKLLIKEA